MFFFNLKLFFLFVIYFKLHWIAAKCVGFNFKRNECKQALNYTNKRILSIESIESTDHSLSPHRSIYLSHVFVQLRTYQYAHRSIPIEIPWWRKVVRRIWFHSDSELMLFISSALDSRLFTNPLCHCQSTHTHTHTHMHWVALSFGVLVHINWFLLLPDIMRITVRVAIVNVVFNHAITNYIMLIVKNYSFILTLQLNFCRAEKKDLHKKSSKKQFKRLGLDLMSAFSFVVVVVRAQTHPIQKSDWITNCFARQMQIVCRMFSKFIVFVC